METKINVLGHQVDRPLFGVDHEAGLNATDCVSTGIADVDRQA